MKIGQFLAEIWQKTYRNLAGLGSKGGAFIGGGALIGSIYGITVVILSPGIISVLEMSGIYLLHVPHLFIWHFTLPSRQFWDRRRWKSGLSIVIWDCGRWKSGPCLLGIYNKLAIYKSTACLIDTRAPIWAIIPRLNTKYDPLSRFSCIKSWHGDEKTNLIWAYSSRNHNKRHYTADT